MKAVKSLVGGLLALLIGCSDGEPTFAVVDGWPLTESYVRDQVLLTAKMAEFSGKKIPAERFADWANRYAMAQVPSIISERLVEEDLRKRGFTPEPEDETAMLTAYQSLSKDFKELDFDGLAKAFGDDASAFRARFRRECLFRSLMRKEFHTEVSKQELAAFYQTKTNLVRQAEQISRDGWRKAKEAWQKLKGGEPWEKVAAAYTEDGLVEPSNANNWKEWTSFNPKTFWVTELQDVLPKCKAGDFTEPVDAEEGLLIVKVLSVDGDIYTCARILIRMGGAIEIPDEATARRTLQNEKFERMQRNYVEKLKSQAKIEYPMGTNFVHYIWKTEK